MVDGAVDEDFVRGCVFCCSVRIFSSRLWQQLAGGFDCSDKFERQVYAKCHIRLVAGQACMLCETLHLFKIAPFCFHFLCIASGMLAV